MSLDLRKHDEGTLLPVKAMPGARKNELRGIHDGRLKVCVTQVAEKGKANKAITQFIAKLLDLPRGDILVVSGQTSSEKQILLRNIKLEDVKHRLSNLIG